VVQSGHSRNRSKPIKILGISGSPRNMATDLWFRKHCRLQRINAVQKPFAVINYSPE